MYGVAGERRLTEVELPWLAGYEGSRPVRIGNGAVGPAPARRLRRGRRRAASRARQGPPASDDAWAMTSKLFDWLESAWREPDEGIWEVRGPRRHFTHSKVMAWVAFDRAVKAVEKLGRDGPVDRWRATRDAIKADVLANGLQRRRRSVRPVVRLRPPGREPAAHPARRLPAREGRAGRRDGRGDPARPHARRLRRALPRGRRERRRRRPAARRRRLPPVLVLARRGARAAGAARRGGRALRAAARAPERPRAALGGVRHRARGGSSATSRRRSRISRSSRPRSRSGGCWIDRDLDDRVIREQAVAERAALRRPDQAQADTARRGRVTWSIPPAGSV